MPWNNADMQAELGQRLRAERKRANLTLRQLQAKFDKPRPAISSLSRWENGSFPIEAAMVEAYLTATQTHDSLLLELVQLAAELEQSPWLATSVPDRERQARALLKIERSAVSITVHTPLIAPGLLQDAAYTEALFRGDGVPDDEIEERVATRRGRGYVLERDDPPEVLFLIGEAMLLTNVGGPAVMKRQLKKLLRATEMSNVDLRIVPLSAGAHRGLTGQFLLYEGPEGPCASSDTQGSALFFRDDAVVAAYRTAAEEILKISMSPADTARLIGEHIDRLEST